MLPPAIPISQLPVPTEGGTSLADGDLIPVTRNGKTYQVVYEGGGGDEPMMIIVVTGQSIELSGLGNNTLVLFNSPIAANKTATLPTSTGSGAEVTIMDFYGSSYSFPITAAPVSGEITGPDSVYTENGAATFVDTPIGWVSI